MRPAAARGSEGDRFEQFLLRVIAPCRGGSFEDRCDLVGIVGGDAMQIVRLRPIPIAGSVIEDRRSGQQLEPAATLDLAEEVTEGVRVVRDFSHQFREIVLARYLLREQAVQPFVDDGISIVERVEEHTENVLQLLPRLLHLRQLARRGEHAAVGEPVEPEIGPCQDDRVILWQRVGIGNRFDRFFVAIRLRLAREEDVFDRAFEFPKEMAGKIAGRLDLREVLEEPAGVAEECSRRWPEADELLVELLLPWFERDRRRFLAHGNNGPARSPAASSGASDLLCRIRVGFGTHAAAR